MHNIYIDTFTHTHRRGSSKVEIVSDHSLLRPSPKVVGHRRLSSHAEETLDTVRGSVTPLELAEYGYGDSDSSDLEMDVGRETTTLPTRNMVPQAQSGRPRVRSMSILLKPKREEEKKKKLTRKARSFSQSISMGGYVCVNVLCCVVLCV
jgi:hypothetical protein